MNGNNDRLHWLSTTQYCCINVWLFASTAVGYYLLMSVVKQNVKLWQGFVLSWNSTDFAVYTLLNPSSLIPLGEVLHNRLTILVERKLWLNYVINEFVGFSVDKFSTVNHGNPPSPQKTNFVNYHCFTLQKTSISLTQLIIYVF